MRELTSKELTLVSGGIVNELFGITQVARGLTAFSVAGAAVGAFSAGYWLGTRIYGSSGFQSLLLKLH